MIITENERRIYLSVAEKFYKDTDLSRQTGLEWEQLDLFDKDGFIAGMKGLYDFYYRAYIKGYNKARDDVKMERRK